MARKTAPKVVHPPQRRTYDRGHPDRPLIAITPGDPDGIGPEIVLKTLRTPLTQGAIPCVVGAEAPLTQLGARFKRIASFNEAQSAAMDLRGGEFLLLPAPTRAPARKLLAGFQAGWSIQTATQAILEGHAQAIVTGPIHKERFQKGGFKFEGHTEFLAHLCRTRGKAAPVTMMLANDLLRVSLVMTHCALGQVSTRLTRERVRRTILHTAHALQTRWKIAQPRIAVAALNPHAGEGGLFGKEEIRVIGPEIAALRREITQGKHAPFTLEGPLPADTLFVKTGVYDAVVCMYHDQGLIPVKLLDFARTVNVSLGLPILRTSVDHGVAFDIAGKGIADPSSFQSALALAISFL